MKVLYKKMGPAIGGFALMAAVMFNLSTDLGVSHNESNLRILNAASGDMDCQCRGDNECGTTMDGVQISHHFICKRASSSAVQ